MDPPALRLHIPLTWHQPPFSNSPHPSQRSLSGRNSRHSLDSTTNLKAVGDQPNDEELIAHAIYASRLKGLNENQAINELHTVSSPSLALPVSTRRAS